MQTQTPDSTTNLTDALRTVAVNSAYNASRSLSKWLKRGVRLTCNGFERIPLAEISSVLGSPDDAVAAVHMPLSGDLTGDVLLAFPENTALALVDRLIDAPLGTSTEFGELEQSCLQETGNIVGSAFANSLGTWLGLDVTPLAPTFAHDLAPAVIQPFLVAQAAIGDDALVSRTEFEMDEQQADWALMLFPSADSLEIMNKRCNTDRVRSRALKTIAINGAFDASRAMSKWLKKGVRLSTEGFERRSIQEVCVPVDSNEPVVALYAQLGDQLHGHALMVVSLRAAKELVDILIGAQPGTTTEFDELARSCLQETGNIISSSFINSWAKWLDIHAEPGPPQLKIDMLEAILQSVLVEQAMEGDDAFMSKSVFSVDGRTIEWDFYLLPTPSSIRLIEAVCR